MQKPLPFINFYGKKVNASVEDKKVNRLILDEAGVWTTNNIENKNKFKTMTDYAIHSPNDGELLIKFHDECVKKGLKSDTEWNSRKNPGTGRRTLHIGFIDNPEEVIMTYFNHDCEGVYEHRDLTPENFNSVLNEVLQNFGIEYKN